MALWLESQQGLLNADYIIKVMKPEHVSREFVNAKPGNWRVTLVSGAGDRYDQVFETSEQADVCFRHYVSVLTSYQG